MSQATTWGVQSAGPATMAQYAVRDNAALDALLSAHRGASRPTYAVASTIWVKAGTAPVTDAEIYYFDGTNDILIATINESTNAITFAGLGTAAVLNVGTSANNIVQLNGSGQLPAVDASLLTGIGGTADQLARDMAMVAFIKADDTAGFQGPIFGDAFTSDSLATKTGATYDAENDLYTNEALAESEETSAGSPSSSTGFDGAIFVDRSWSVDNGRTVSHIAFSSNTAAGDYDVYIFERIGSGSYTPRAKIASVSHPGGLAVTYFELATPYAVPGSGDFYVGVDTKSNGTQGKTGSVARATRSSGSLTVDTNYNSGWTEATQSTVFVGVRYAAEVVTDMTLRPSAITLPTANPSDVSLYAVVEELTGADASTNVKARVSIDNGSTYTTAAVADAEWPFTNDRLLRFDADVSGQTGSQLIWEITSENNQQFKVKEVRGVPINA